MNKEGFVSLKVAKLLKNFNFNWECHSMYARHRRVRNEIMEQFPGLSDSGYRDLLKINGGDFNDNEVYAFYIEPIDFYCKNEPSFFKNYPYMICSRPSLYKAQKWLRLIHNIHIIIDVKSKKWFPKWKTTDGKVSIGLVNLDSEEIYKGSYEEALDFGILSVLKHMDIIEYVKFR